MPRCENEKCGKENIPSSEVFKGTDTSKIYCAGCVGKDGLEEMTHCPPKEQSLVLGREFDYGVSYTREDGLKAGMRLGGASLSFEVNSDELDRTFGSVE